MQENKLSKFQEEIEILRRQQEQLKQLEIIEKKLREQQSTPVQASPAKTNESEHTTSSNDKEPGVYSILCKYFFKFYF